MSFSQKFGPLKVSGVPEHKPPLTFRQSKTALITGAGRGLGKAIAESLHACGMQVVLADIDIELVQNAALSLDSSGKSAIAMELDVANANQFEQVFNDTVARLNSVDVLINNAGITIAQDFFSISPEDWHRVMDVNLTSVFYGCQLAARHMKNRGHGRIVNISSKGGQLGSPLSGAHYSVSKAGIICLTKVVASELAGHGVTVNSVAPAVVRAPVMDTLPQDKLESMIEQIPVKRIGEASEVAALVTYLVSDQAGYVTGATMDINGGLYMR